VEQDDVENSIDYLSISPRLWHKAMLSYQELVLQPYMQTWWPENKAKIAAMEL